MLQPPKQPVFGLHRTLPKSPRVLMAGSGAIGAYAGGLMIKDGWNVTMADGWKAHVDAINANGIKITGTDPEHGEYLIPATAIHFDDLGKQAHEAPFDVIILSVKSYALESVASMLLAYAHDKTVFVALMNTMPDRRLAAVVGAHRTVGCIVTISSSLYDPGHVFRTDQLTSGYFNVGELDGEPSPRTAQLAKMFESASRSWMSTTLMKDRYGKLCGNCSSNALVGLSGLPTSEVLRDRMLMTIGVHALAETAAVARAEGNLPPKAMGIPINEYFHAVKSKDLRAILTKIHDFTFLTKNTGVASFGQDVKKGRRTEVDYLNGYVVGRGRELDVDTPVCKAIVALVHERVHNLKPGQTYVQSRETLRPLFDRIMATGVRIE